MGTLNTKEMPLNTKEMPLNTKEVPLNTKEMPLNTKEMPLNTKEMPLNTKEMPLNTKEVPLNTKETPLNTKETPLNTKEMKKLRRSEMLEMMLLQSNEIEKLQAEVTQLTAKLNDRSIAVDKAGTLAEASILISNVLKEADRAAKDYLINIERLSGDADRVSRAKIADTQLKADVLIMDAKGKAAALLSQAQKEAESIIFQATVRRDRIKREADTYWAEVSARLEAFYQEHWGLREMLSSVEGIIGK